MQLTYNLDLKTEKDKAKKLIATFDFSDPEDRDTLKRVVFADDVFGLLWDIREGIRTFNKWGEGKKTAQEKLDEISDLIYESGLLDMYT